jgi:protein-tyrosine phosphatase
MKCGEEVLRLFEDRFAILFVCHANLCRSPMAEFLARRALDDAFGWQARSVVVASAGTHAYAGSPMHPGSATVLAEAGADGVSFVSRRVDARVLAGADLVLTAGRVQRSACAELAPEVLGRTFTLLQFARLVTAVPPVPALVTGPPVRRMRTLVEQVRAHRHRAPRAPAADDELADPVGRPVEEFRECAATIWQSFGAVVRVIAAS